MSESYNIVDLVDHGASSGAVQFEERTAYVLRHFHFHEHPFGDNVNPKFFFRTEAHEDAYIKMKRCIEDHVAVGLTTALSGTGKTLLTQILISELNPAQYETILVLAYPGMTRSGLLREVATELGLEALPARAPFHQLMSAVQERIMALYAAGKQLVITVDECHFLGLDALQVIRTLSNMEVPERKLVTLLLFGEEFFQQKLARPEFASIANRMFIRARLRPLTAEETEQYVKFRCLVSGGRPAVFASDVYPLLHELSAGIPRDINRLCHTALFEAARRGKAVVDRQLLAENVS
ncbi:MAG: ExeA family protein [Candidatus Sumerlaeaceae bacterium]|jgi:type II secretory pathway predicted ATPase ExeA